MKKFLVSAVLAAGAIVAAPAPTMAAPIPTSPCGVLGGGPGYAERVGRTATSPDVTTVRNFTQFEAAINARAPYIFIPADGIVDIPTTANRIIVPDGTTIFGDRGVGASRGGLIRMAAAPVQDWIAVMQLGRNTRVSSLRVQGPSGDINTPSHLIGMQARDTADAVVVDNNELFNFTWSPMSFASGSTGNTFRHNYVHHNRRAELGYGVVVQSGGNAIIRCNVFDANRHAIAGAGDPGDSYEASNNVVLRVGNGHSLDMHAGATTNQGGQYVRILNNWIDFNVPSDYYASINIRGVPAAGTATITGNVFSSRQDDSTPENLLAVKGVAGAVPSRANLRANNTFGASLQVVTAANGQCTLRVNNGGAITDVGRILCGV